MIAYREETIKFYTTIRLNDSTAPGAITTVEFQIRQDDRQITQPVAMTQDTGTRYYASWTVPVRQDFGQYFVVVTATVDASAWEKVIETIEIRENIEAMILDMYIRSLAVQHEKY
ncbi:MAG: hypothetical protein H8D67_18960 [Deltaproteobacteria bacterium]|nr:hypothetical protein [Deltaproteobacteria bacterium]